MIRIFRWLFRILTGLVLLGLIGLGIGYWFLSRSLPNYSEDFALVGLGGPVEIVRNSNDVPHIFGQTDADVFRALGFVHAQDRLWQMTLLRRTAQGRLSEIFGDRTLRTDAMMRRLDLYGLAQSSVAAQDERTRVALEAYAAGVNDWIDQINVGARGRGAPQFFLFSNAISPWQPADSLAILKLLALQMSSKTGDEVLRARMSLILPPERLRDILPDDPGAAVMALPRYSEIVPDVSPDYTPIKMADALSPFAMAPFGGASNAWAAAPTRSTADGSLLANDPHLPFSAPTIWYLARMELSTGGVIGGTIPGMPLILSGRSDSFGWGLTTAYVDDQDLFVEEVNPDRPDQYRTPEGWEPFRTERSIIRIKDAAPATVTLRWTENGPVLPASHYDVGSITPAGHVMSLRWTGLDPQDTSMTAAMGLMYAEGIDAAMAAGRDFVAPAQNLMLADADGIALQTVGAIPARNPAMQGQGRIPSPGWIAQNRWLGIAPYDTNPRERDPASGILGNTNNKTVDRPFPDHVSFDWGDTQRIQRWLTLMRARNVHTRDSFIEAQLDTVSTTMREVLPLVGADLWYVGADAPDGTPERLRQRALAMLAQWNGEMNEHMPEPLIAQAWLSALQDRLIRDDIGPMADQFSHVDATFLGRVYRNEGGAGVWCDLKQTSVEETCADAARIALDDALLWLSERYGANLESWRWGDAHQATHDDPVLGNLPGLRYLVNIRQSTSGGDDTLNRGVTKGFGRDPFQNVHGAGYRGVYDFADPDSSVFITSTGQSGHPLSQFYDDLGGLWRRGEYVPMSLDPDLARAAAVGITHLTPAP
ncbi:penicillin acylase family protein [Falsirhodobacter halotolerans]|uniref:penicillin acylase family protein n=1 Tax=Falsirhodobacter halotolerans TaxID=1146892 RepID=UPI001FD490E5|nr:penicillin acylase family protein [Falsirhodobacter halotolerans]MCJ8139673.1 penicillin acylase family protein [Falsirhodobacter halotolerans]